MTESPSEATDVHAAAASAGSGVPRPADAALAPVPAVGPDEPALALSPVETGLADEPAPPLPTSPDGVMTGASAR